MNDAEDIAPQVRPEPGEVGLVESRDFHHPLPFTFESGQVLPGFTLRYETYGHLNAPRDNAIMVLHALSGDHHCAGIHALADRKPGWWNNLIGPGKAVDTNQYFVLCANVLGGCQGTTGPSSPAPDGVAWGSRFPRLTIRDQVAAEVLLADHLGIDRWAGVVGGSMGGMRVLEWCIGQPDRVARAAPAARPCSRVSPPPGRPGAAEKPSRAQPVARPVGCQEKSALTPHCRRNHVIDFMNDVS